MVGHSLARNALDNPYVCTFHCVRNCIHNIIEMEMLCVPTEFWASS